jgi:hypothetical protein
VDDAVESRDAGPSAAYAVAATRSPDRGEASARQVFPLLLALLAAAQVALFAYLLARTAIASPISDMFAYIDVYLRFRAGEMSLFDYLWRAHGEHHLLWIRLLTWADVALFHTRGLPFMAAASTAIGATALLLVQQMRRAEPRLGRATQLGLLVPMLILSAANVTDCSVPINTTYPLTVFFVVASLVLFAGAADYPAGSLYRRIGALVAAFAASLATAAGLLAWPILLWIAWRERLNGLWMAALAVIGIAYGLFYAQGLTFLGLAPAVAPGSASLFAPAHLLQLVYYFFAFLGLPLTREPSLGVLGPAFGVLMFLGGLAAVLAATCTKMLNTRLDRIAVGLILFAFGAAALAAVGRSDLAEGLKVPVRYALFATALQVGLISIVLPRAARSAATPRARTGLALAGLAIAALLVALQVLIGRAAVTIATRIARDADCFAAGAHNGPINPIVTRYQQDAEQVLAALRAQHLLAPRPRDCARPSAD